MADMAKLNDPNILQQIGSGIRNTVVPAVVSGTQQMADAATVGPRLGIAALRNIASGFTGNPDIPTNIPSVPLPAPNGVNTRADRVGTGVRIVGGNSPEAIAAGVQQPTPTPSLSSTLPGPPTLPESAFTNVPKQDRVIQNVGMVNTPEELAQRQRFANMDKIIATSKDVTPEQVAQVQQLKQQWGFKAGGTDRVPVGPDGRPLAGGIRNSGVTDSGLSIQFDPSVDAATRQNVMVDMGTNDPVAQERRALAHQQFIDRNASNAPVSDGLSKLSPGRAAEIRLKRDEMAQAERLANATLASGAPGRAATTALTQAQAAALPESNAAEVAYKKAQTEAANAAAQASKVIKIDNTPDILGRPKETQLYDMTKHEWIQSPTPQLPTLTDEQKKLAVTYGKKNPNMDKNDILRRIASGELK